MSDPVYARFATWLLLLVGAAVVGCEDEATSTAVAPQKTTVEHPKPGRDSESATDRQDAGLPEDPLLRTLHHRAGQHAPKLIPAREPFEGTVHEGRSREVLAVLTGGLCYKIIGVHDEGIEYLELTLLDPNQVPAQHVSGKDRVPLLGVQEAICPRETGSYQIRIQARGPSGRYAVGLYRSKF